MPAPKIYIDTSVIGGYFDDEFQAETRRLWSLRKKSQFHFTTSILTLEEILTAPTQVQELFAKTFDEDSILPSSFEAEELARAYMERGVVPTKYFEDAQHVAICTLARINCLVSWNYKHLANLQRENAFNGVNLLHGYAQVRILCPTSLIYGHEKEV
jgi:predicted nucleic acid-binding protein